MDLWEDWCAVTGTSPGCRDDAVLARFARQAGASRRLVHALEPPVTDRGHRAAAWRRGHDDPDALRRLLHRGSRLAGDPGTFWTDRLKLRRMLFAATLLAPLSAGGLGLTRGQALGLTPPAFQEMRPLLGTAVQESSCPACAAWSWLEVLGTNAAWSAAMVRSLAKRPGGAAGKEALHRHERNDPDTGWSDWQDCPNLLPGIDRWGYLNRYSSMHRSSLSRVIAVMALLLEAPLRQHLQTLPALEPPAIRHVTAEEEAAIFARADELNARVAALLAEFE